MEIQKQIPQRWNPFSDFAFDCKSEIRILKSKSRFPNRTHPQCQRMTGNPNQDFPIQKRGILRFGGGGKSKNRSWIHKFHTQGGFFGSNPNLAAKIQVYVQKLPQGKLNPPSLLRCSIHTKVTSAIFDWVTTLPHLTGDSSLVCLFLVECFHLAI